MNLPRRAAGALLALAAAGCAPVRACAQWYAALDEAVDAEGVRDAQHARVPGFPYLRVNRILASLRGRAAASEATLQAFDLPERPR